MTQAAILAASGSPGTTTGFKNRIINGNMAIDQRNGGSAVTPANTYTLDRWICGASQSSKFTVQQVALGGALAGFPYALKVVSSSAYSVTSTDFFTVEQNIEGYNASDFNWGTANAQSVTVSFWVYSSLTGTFGGAFYAGTGSLGYPFSYSIPVAATWTKVSFTIPPQTGGTWVSNNTKFGTLCFSLGMGSDYSYAAGTWATGTVRSATGAVSVVGTSGATFYVTGVQLEVGTTATNFDFRSIGTELNLCQRYFYKTNPDDTQYSGGGLAGVVYNANSATMIINHPVFMRTAPTVTRGGSYNYFYIAGVAGTVSGNFDSTRSYPNSFWAESTSLNAGGNGYQITYSGQLSASAEL